MKTYLTEFISGFALLKPRESRILSRAKKYEGKTTLSDQEALEFARESRIFYNSLRVHLMGMILSMLVLITGTIGACVAIFFSPNLVPWFFSLVGAYVIIHIIITLGLRKTHCGGLITLS